MPSVGLAVGLGAGVGVISIFTPRNPSHPATARRAEGERASVALKSATMTATVTAAFAHAGRSTGLATGRNKSRRAAQPRPAARGTAASSRILRATRPARSGISG